MLTKKDHLTHAEGNASHAERLRTRAVTYVDGSTAKRQALATAAFLDRISAAHAKRAL